MFARAGELARREARAHTRRRTLGAAARLFATRGVSGASVADVAESAGLPKAAVLADFVTTDALVLAILDRHLGQGLDRAAETLKSVGGLADAPRMVGESLALGRDGATGQHLLFEYAALASRNPVAHAALARRREEHLAVVASEIAAVAESRGFELPMSPAELAVVVLVLTDGLALEASINPRRGAGRPVRSARPVDHRWDERTRRVRRRVASRASGVRSSGEPSPVERRCQ